MCSWSFHICDSELKHLVHMQAERILTHKLPHFRPTDKCSGNDVSADNNMASTIAVEATDKQHLAIQSK